MKWEAGKTSVFRENSNGSIGLTFDHQGRLLTCERGRVTRTEKDGKIMVLADGAPRPNDLVYAIDGSIYFSDAATSPSSDLPDHAERRGAGRVARLRTAEWSGAGAQSAKVIRGETAGQKIWVYEIAGDGTLRDGRVFAPARCEAV